MKLNDNCFDFHSNGDISNSVLFGLYSSLVSCNPILDSVNSANSQKRVLLMKALISYAEIENRCIEIGFLQHIELGCHFPPSPTFPEL